MKNQFKFLPMILALLALLFTLVAPTPVKAQNSFEWKLLVSDSTALATNAITTITNSYLSIRPTSKGVSVMHTFSSAAGDTNAVIFVWATSLDSTNYTTLGTNGMTSSGFLTSTNYANGTNVVRQGRTFGPELLGSARRIKFLGAVTASGSTSTVTVTRIEASTAY